MASKEVITMSKRPRIYEGKRWIPESLPPPPLLFLTARYSLVDFIVDTYNDNVPLSTSYCCVVVHVEYFDFTYLDNTYKIMDIV